MNATQKIGCLKGEQLVWCSPLGRGLPFGSLTPVCVELAYIRGGCLGLVTRLAVQWVFSQILVRGLQEMKAHL